MCYVRIPGGPVGVGGGSIGSGCTMSAADAVSQGMKFLTITWAAFVLIDSC